MTRIYIYFIVQLILNQLNVCHGEDKCFHGERILGNSINKYAMADFDKENNSDETAISGNTLATMF